MFDNPFIFFLDGGHTVIDYNSNSTTWVVLKIIGGQFIATVLETAPIQEWIATIDHISIHIRCSIYYYNNQEFYMNYTLLASFSNQPWN